MSASTPIIGPEGSLNGRLDDSAGELFHVAVGVVRNARGEVLIARRLPGAHLAGLWEFPGGKLEPGEAPREGLIRELREELGIAVLNAVPLIQVRHAYPERRVLLDVWEVLEFTGDPVGREGQPLQWVTPDHLPTISFPAANRPIATAVRLPDFYAILEADRPDPALLMDNLAQLAENGIRMIQCRAKVLQSQATFPAFAESVIDFCRVRDIRVLLNADPAMALALGADGVHLTAQRLRGMSERPGDDGFWVAASCHDAAELRHAARVGVDFAVLGPVGPTASHPGMAAIGWECFRALAALASFPVYALGGLSAADLLQSRHCGARGVAAVRGLLTGAPYNGAI
jgi:8-oxo-dGTP diphosphatase